MRFTTMYVMYPVGGVRPHDRPSVVQWVHLFSAEDPNSGLQVHIHLLTEAQKSGLQAGTKITLPVSARGGWCGAHRPKKVIHNSYHR
jgi:hypothetical protein